MKTNNQFIYHDIQALSSAKGKNSEAKESLELAAKHFEGVFLQMLIKSMRKSNELFSEGSLFDSNEHQFYQQMFDEQLSLTLSQNNGVGLAPIIVQQLSPALNNESGNETPGEDKNLSVPISSKTPGGNALPSTTDSGHIDQEALLKPLSEHPIWNDPIEMIKTRSSTKEYDAVPIDSKESPVNSKQSLRELEENKLDFSKPSAFVESVLPYAQKAADKLGLSPLFLVAQAALETGWGQHIMKNAEGEPSNNLFGIKADKRWSGDYTVKNTVEFDGPIAKKTAAKFRVYDSIEESFLDYADFISSQSRYANALAKKNQPEDFFNELQAGGYATDPNYANKILRILNSDTLSHISLANQYPNQFVN